MVEIVYQFLWMCLAGIIPVVFFAIDDVHKARRKWQAFKRFVKSKRFVIGVSMAIYGVISIFTTVYGWDIVSSLAFLTPIPACTSFGIGVGVSIGAMLKDGE